MKTATLNNLTLAALTTLLLFFCSTSYAYADYDRNQAVPVEKVLFGTLMSVRNISQEALIQDKNNGWHTFGGALIGGAIGHQFGGGSGKDVATILGAMIGGSIANNSIANNRHNQPEKVLIQLVELMIKLDDGEQFMVIQDFDKQMIFHSNDKVRMIYLANNTVRIDKQR